MAGEVAEIETPAPAGFTLAKGTPVLIAIDEPLSSDTSKPMDMFAIRTFADVVVDGHVVVPAGSKGMGEVIHADKSGMGGKRGELILAARHVEVGDARVKLRRFRFGYPEGYAGADNSGDATTLAMVGALVPAASLVAMFMTGGETDVPVGALANVIVAEDVTLPALSILQEDGPLDAIASVGSSDSGEPTDEGKFDGHFSPEGEDGIENSAGSTDVSQVQ